MRSKRTPKRITPADPIYDSVMVAKFINGVMQDGRKSVAQKIIYNMIDTLKEKTGQDGLTYLTEAVENVKPNIEVRSRRVGGASYQVPSPVRPERRDSLALRWIINAAKDRSNSSYHTFSEKLVAELMEAHENQGNAIKKKFDTHKMAEANKAFAHFRW